MYDHLVSVQGVFNQQQGDSGFNRYKLDFPRSESEQITRKSRTFCQCSTFSLKNLTISKLVGGSATPLKNMKVSWDD